MFAGPGASSFESLDNPSPHQSFPGERSTLKTKSFILTVARAIFCPRSAQLPQPSPTPSGLTDSESAGLKKEGIRQLQRFSL